MDKTKIEWTDATWNPVVGCSRVSEGCRHCYAETMAVRQVHMGTERYQGVADVETRRWTGKVNIAPEKTLLQPLRWKRRRKIFVNSMSDLFHENLPFEEVDKVFAVMALCPQPTFQVLTKRPERMREYFVADPYLRIRQLVDDGPISDFHFSRLDSFEKTQFRRRWGTMMPDLPLRNVWLGVSVENQDAADERIPKLLDTPAAVRFLSCEPLLGPVDLTRLDATHKTDPGFSALSCGIDDEGTIDTAVDWVIVGGESGHGARPMRADWVRGIRDQCAAAGVPFFFKQWGEYDEHGACVGKYVAGRVLDGRKWDEFPMGVKNETV